MEYNRDDWQLGDLAWVTSRRTSRQVRILCYHTVDGRVREVWYGKGGYVLADSGSIRDIERAVAVTEDQHNIIETVEHTRSLTPEPEPVAEWVVAADQTGLLQVGDRVRVTDARTSIARRPVGSGESEWVGRPGTIRSRGHHNYYIDFDGPHEYEGSWSRDALDLLVPATQERGPITTTGDQRRAMPVEEAYPIGSIWQHHNVGGHPFTVTGWSHNNMHRHSTPGNNRIEGLFGVDTVDWYRGALDLNSTMFVGWSDNA